VRPSVVSPDEAREYPTPEGCSILESWNDASDAAASIARARVAPGAATRSHRLSGVVERYLIAQGRGTVRIGDAIERDVGPGDVVVIPAGVAQSIANIGDGDLVFYCVCTPRFTPGCYEALE
jgi:mannose-6-phosphate isomerase-like protein (cupin superfamily)